jgi:hypothetical protein
MCHVTDSCFHISEPSALRIGNPDIGGYHCNHWTRSSLGWQAQFGHTTQFRTSHHTAEIQLLG